MTRFGLDCFLDACYRRDIGTTLLLAEAHFDAINGKGGIVPPPGLEIAGCEYPYFAWQSSYYN